ncbi:MAG: 2Fe-2S iron-sulfur cluster-binding protein [Pyrinomonadaceae bacterium]
MTRNAETPFESFLNRHDDAAWAVVVASLAPSIHEVDRTATQIWFYFYPLALLRALEQAEDAERLAQELLLQGNYYLKDQIDTSHKFLYGHRFWPEVIRAVTEYAADANHAGGDLKTQILEIARRVAADKKHDESLLVGITAVAFMTLQQVGIDAFKAAPGRVHIDSKHAKKSPEQILRERAKDDSQGLFGFLKTVDREWTVTFDENDTEAKYKMRDGADLAYGAADDRSREWTKLDPRRIEGPIPVECRSAACGTCWVGVLGGAEKLSDVQPRLEGKRIKEFGYINTDEPKPLIRLACQAQAQGAVSIVIPPWNGVFGKGLRAQQEQTSEESQPDMQSSESVS